MHLIFKFYESIDVVIFPFIWRENKQFTNNLLEEAIKRASERIVKKLENLRLKKYV